MNATEIEALRAFYVGSRQQLFTYALSITGNREVAEDVIHGVIEKLLRSKALPADLRPYAFRAVRNAAFDGWRRAKVRTESIFEAAAAGDAGLDAPAEMRREDLRPLLERLSADEREAVILRIYSGLTFQEIADLRGVPLATASSWYRRGLEHLRTMLTDELDG